MLDSASTRGSNRVLFNAAWLLEHFFGWAPRLAGGFRRLRNRARERVVQRLLSEPASALQEVPRRSDLTLEEFARDYRQRSLPVVFAGAARDWPCCREWSPDYFAEHYRNYRLPHINVSRDELRADDYRAQAAPVTVGAVVADMHQGGPGYARFGALLDDHTELRAAFAAEFLRGGRDPISGGENFQFFMGGQGTNTAIHNAIGSNLFVQVYGRKRWILVPPSFTPLLDPPVNRAPYFFSHLDVERDAETHPELQRLRGYEVVLEPGDILYNPPFYWHQVENLGPTIGVGYRWYGLSSILRASPVQALLTIAATNPPVWQARKHKGNFAQIFASTAARADSAPGQSTSAESASAAPASADSALAGSTPAESAPAESAPADSAPVDPALADATPADSTPRQSTSAPREPG